MSEIIMTEISEPSAPSAGNVTIYINTSGSLCLKTDDGTVYRITLYE